MQTLEILVLLSLFNVAILILATKWGLVTWYQLHRPKFLPQSCNFCLFFWLAFLQMMLMHFDCIRGKFHVYDCIITPFAYALMCSVLSLFFKPKFSQSND